MTPQKLTVAAAVLLFSGCAKQPAPIVINENQELLQRDSAWSAAASEGKDVEKIISYWSDDAVIIPQGQPIVEGKAAIRAYITDALKIPGFHIHWVSRDPRFSPGHDGQLAYMRGENEMTVPGPDGKPMTLHGRGVTVWRRDPDGQWRCVVDTWNDPPPPPPTQATATPVKK